MGENKSKDWFDAAIKTSRNDAAGLTAIEEELRALTTPWATTMRLRVINMRRQSLRAPSSLDQNPRAVPIAPPSSWGGPFGLPAPDGRPLHRYQITNTNFAALEAHLQGAVRADGFGSRQNEALFVLWAAEWFRRSFRGGQRKWSDVGGRFGLNLAQASWRAIADRGLGVWQLRPLRLHGATHRLLNLARQGGFPVAAIEDAGGWAASYLEALVGVLLGEAHPTPENAFGHAQQLGGKVPESWQHDEFFAVSADLAISVVVLRREAEAGGMLAGLPPSLWLDVNRPEWREQLPLSLDNDVARRLIDELMTAVMVKGGTGAVQVTRLLEKEGDVWQPRLRFELNGRLKGTDFAALDATWSRLRMFATGTLAGHVSGELAVLEPGDGGEWLATASRAGKPSAVPFSVPVDVELRGGGERVGPIIRLARGEPIQAEMLVLGPIEDRDDGTPRHFEVIGTSSGKYRPDPLFLMVPSEWSAPEPLSADDLVEPCDEQWEGRRLWRIVGGATVANDDGDRYRLSAGQKTEDRDALTVIGRTAFGLKSADETPVRIGTPTLFVRERGIERTPPSGVTFWRSATDRTWLPFERSDTIGAGEIAWRDAATNAILDRHRIVILPADFEFTVRRVGDHAEVSVTGWPGSYEVSPGQQLDDGRWSVRTRGRSLLVPR